MANHDHKLELHELKESRYRIDPIADLAAQSIIDNKDVRHLQKVLMHMATKDQGIPEELPPDAQKYFEVTAAVNFTNEEKARLDRASDIFATYGPMVVMSLIFRSLPTTYMAQKPAHVLDLTKLLENYAERRIIETAQFVFDVMEKGWYNPDKRGIRTIQRVRLMHASMRHLIMHSIEHDPEDMAYPWKDEWGLPISQEDMLATLQTFSLEVIHGMERLGIHLTQNEMDDWFFAWEKIGLILGVEPKLLPKNREQAQHIQNMIYDQLFMKNNEPGEKLIKALVKTVKDLSPSNFLKSNVLVIMRYMINNDDWYFNYLKLPGGARHRFFLFLMKLSIHLYGWLARITGGSNGHIAKMAMHLLNGIYNAERGGKDASFLVPDDLCELWNLERKLSHKHQ